MVDRYGVPLESREPGKAATTAKTALTVGGGATVAASAAAGAIIGTGVFPGIGTAVGTAVGAIGGLIGTVLGMIGGAIDPQRAATRTALMQQGLSREYADGYAKYVNQPDEYLVAQAGALADKAAKGNKKGKKARDELAAIRTIRAERAAGVAVEHAAYLAAQPRSGNVPLWAPAAILAILAVGAVLIYTRRSRKR